MENKIVFYSSKENTAKLLVIGGAFIYLGGYILTTSPIIPVLIIAILIIILGTISAYFGILSLLNIKPKLQINKEGIKDNRISNKLIYWNEIESIKLIYESNRNKLHIKLINRLNPNNMAFLYRLSSSKKNNNKEIKIDLSQLNINISQLINILDKNN